MNHLGVHGGLNDPITHSSHFARRRPIINWTSEGVAGLCVCKHWLRPSPQRLQGLSRPFIAQELPHEAAKKNLCVVGGQHDACVIARVTGHSVYVASYECQYATATHKFRDKLDTSSNWPAKG